MSGSLVRVWSIRCLVGALLFTPSRAAAQDATCAVTGTSSFWANFVQAKQSGTEPTLPDFSYAGYHRSEMPIPTIAGPIFNVTAYGALPGDALYDDDGIQAAINAAASAGGGVVFLPAGQYLVSPSETSTMTIKINASRVILRGAGSADGGTEIIMVNKRQGLTMFSVAPASWGAATVANVTACATRETFWLTVDNTAKLSVGQWVVLRHQSKEYSAVYWGGLALSSSWTRVYNSGTGVHEVHQIAEIAGNQVRFHEPLHFNVVLNNTAWRLESVNPLEEIGIEDIRFTGKWDTYPETFVHHKDWIHDSGWTMLGIKQVVNSWVRRVEFRHLNQAISSDTASFMTFDDIKYTGKKGHTSISHRRGYGVLVKDNEDTAAFHHGPGTGYNSVGVVYLRHKMQVGQQIDNHGGVPHATLLDQITGGVMRGNGGPYDNYPHHGRYFVFWNFAHRSTSSYSYDFWDNVNRDSHTFALPIFVGFTANTAVTFQNESTEVGANESFGTAVTPGSLFEAQLQFRLCSAAAPPPPPQPVACPAPPPPPPPPPPSPSELPLGPNLAKGKPASASTTWSSSYIAAKAFDGSDSTRWSASAASATNQWLAVDLGPNVRYNCVQMKEINYKRVQSHVLQQSDDGVNYSDIPGTVATTIGALKTTCFETVRSRYLRLFMFTSISGSSLKEPTVNEVGVYFQDRPPIIVVPDMVTAEATGPGGAAVTFLAYAEDEVDGNVPVTLNPPSGATFPLGTTRVAATATDSAGHTASAEFDVIVDDTTAPAIDALTASAASLWPPNHQMVLVTVTAAITEAVDPAPVTRIVEVTSNEPANGTGDGDTEPDWRIAGPMELELRAERAGTGSGRIYAITVESRDASGNASTKIVEVMVPKSSGG